MTAFKKELKLVDSIEPGDKVTIINRSGQKRTGRAVMRARGGIGWVLNMGGQHGTPGIATDENTVDVVKSKKRGDPESYRRLPEALAAAEKNVATQMRGEGMEYAVIVPGRSPIYVEDYDAATKIAKQYESLKPSIKHIDTLMKEEIIPERDVNKLISATLDRILSGRSDNAAAAALMEQMRKGYIVEASNTEYEDVIEKMGDDYGMSNTLQHIIDTYERGGLLSQTMKASSAVVISQIRKDLHEDKKQIPDRDAFANLATRSPIGEAIDLVANVAGYKSENIRTNWQDRKTSGVWDKIMHSLQKLVSQAAEEKVEVPPPLERGAPEAEVEGGKEPEKKEEEFVYKSEGKVQEMIYPTRDVPTKFRRLLSEIEDLLAELEESESYAIEPDSTWEALYDFELPYIDGRGRLVVAYTKPMSPGGGKRKVEKISITADGGEDALFALRWMKKAIRKGLREGAGMEESRVDEIATAVVLVKDYNDSKDRLEYYFKRGNSRTQSFSGSKEAYEARVNGTLEWRDMEGPSAEEAMEAILRGGDPSDISDSLIGETTTSSDIADITVPLGMKSPQHPSMKRKKRKGRLIRKINTNEDYIRDLAEEIGLSQEEYDLLMGGADKSVLGEKFTDWDKQEEFVDLVGGTRRADRLMQIYNDSYPSGTEYDKTFKTGQYHSKEDIFRRRAKREGFKDKEIDMFLEL